MKFETDKHAFTNFFTRKFFWKSKINENIFVGKIDVIYFYKENSNEIFLFSSQKSNNRIKMELNLSE
jgi:hypothetical protein